MEGNADVGHRPNRPTSAQIPKSLFGFFASSIFEDKFSPPPNDLIINHKKINNEMNIPSNINREFFCIFCFNLIKKFRKNQS